MTKLRWSARPTRGVRAGFALAAAAALAACSVQIQNRQAAQELAEQAKPPGSVYTGWRVFQDRCARCHGADATGGAGGGPDLLARVRDMPARRFVGVVLNRYEWNLPPVQAGTPGGRDGAAFESLIDAIEQRREGALVMPVWQGEPRVNAHIVDLYAWLAARAQGTQGPGRPAP